MISLFRHGSNIQTFKKFSLENFLTKDSISYVKLATGRSALFYLLNRLEDFRKKHVLLPCYVAEGVIQPFVEAGCSIIFYQLDSKLNPVYDNVDKIMKSLKSPPIIVLIHYFGFPISSKIFGSIFEKHDALVIHDCAHALYNTKDSFGELQSSMDIILYSLNKFLPLVDGAYLLSNIENIELQYMAGNFSELPLEVQGLYLEHLNYAADLFESSDYNNTMDLIKKMEASYNGYYEYIGHSMEFHMQSLVSKNIEENYNHDQLIKQRRSNIELLYNELDSPYFSFVYDKPDSGVFPFAVPARVQSQYRNKILDKLFHDGILLSTLIEKWDFIPDRDKFIEESKFIDEHVLIPINEFISTNEMSVMVEKINNIKIL